MARRNRRARAARRPNGSWRNRDTRIAAARFLVALAAIGGLFALGYEPTGPSVAPHGPYVYMPANDFDRLSHDLHLEWEIEQATKNGWGSD